MIHVLIVCNNAILNFFSESETSLGLVHEILNHTDGSKSLQSSEFTGENLLYNRKSLTSVSQITSLRDLKM